MWFGSDVDKASNTKKGVMDTKLCESATPIEARFLRRSLSDAILPCSLPPQTTTRTPSVPLSP